MNHVLSRVAFNISGPFIENVSQGIDISLQDITCRLQLKTNLDLSYSSPSLNSLSSNVNPTILSTNFNLLTDYLEITCSSGWNYYNNGIITDEGYLETTLSFSLDINGNILSVPFPSLLSSSSTSSVIYHLPSSILMNTCQDTLNILQLSFYQGKLAPMLNFMKPTIESKVILATQGKSIYIFSYFLF